MRERVVVRRKDVGSVDALKRKVKLLEEENQELKTAVGVQTHK